MTSALYDTGEGSAAHHAPGESPLAAALVAVCWVACAVSLVWLVAAFGESLPFYDEFGLIPYVTGDAPLTLQFLWSQHGEHRILLPRLVYVLVARLADGDLKAVQYLNALLLSGLSLAAILTARHLRGRTTYPDAVLALVCFGSTHTIDILWGFEIVFVLSTVFAGIVILVCATSGTHIRLRQAVVAGAATACLPLCGGSGLLLVPGCTAWLVWRAWHAWRSGDIGQRRAAWVACALAALALSLSVLYLVDYSAPADRGAVVGMRVLGTTAVQLLALSVGIAARHFWPLSGVAILGMLTLAVGLGLARQRRVGFLLSRRGLVLVLLAFLTLAVGTAWGRSAYGVWDPRYVTLMMPLLIALHFAFVAAEPTPSARVGQLALLALVLIALPINVREGQRHWQAWSQMYGRFRQDVDSGMPARLLALRHHGPPIAGLYPDPTVLEKSILMLQRAGLSGLEGIAPGYGDRTLEEVPFDGSVVSTNQVTWENGRGSCLGQQASLVFQLPAPRHVYAIRFNARFWDRADGSVVARLRAFWTLDGRPFSDDQAISRDVQPFASWVTIWIDTVVDQLRLDPDIGPCQFQFTDMTMITSIH